MIIELLSQEHRNIERLLAVLEHELDIFDRSGRPDYEVIRAIIAYFEVYTEMYHHAQEDRVFAKLKIRDPAAVEKIGDLAHEHREGAKPASPKPSTACLPIASSFVRTWTASFAISWSMSGVISGWKIVISFRPR
ncbi:MULTISPECIES: hemerythrin domain-containing protein [unclassified Bradyrhizobium]